MNKPKLNENDVSREWLKWAKVIHFFRVLFIKKATEVLLYANTFSSINFDWLSKWWTKWIILDIDECVAPHHWHILPENMEILKDLSSQYDENWEKKWKIIVYSNMQESDRYDELKDLWVEVMTSKYAKPDKRWFEECLEVLWLEKKQVVMIWDNFLTDWWCIYAWIRFIKVDPIFTNSVLEDIKGLKLWRGVQVIMRNVVDKVAKIRRKSVFEFLKGQF